MEEEIKKIIEENPIALATVNGDGNPYCIAVAYVKVKDKKIVITTNYMNKTLENIKNNNKICLVVWNSNLIGYQIIGEAEYFDKGEWLEFVKTIPENKDEPCKGALVVEVNNIKKLK